MTTPRTNQRDGQIAYHVDDTGENPHVNYEPSSLGGLAEASRAGRDHEPEISGPLTRRTLSRTDDYAQAGERYRTMPNDEREDLVFNFVDFLGQCEEHVQERMVAHFMQCDAELGRRVAAGLGLEGSTNGSVAQRGVPARAQ